MTIIDLHPIGEGWGGWAPRQTDAVRGMCESIAKFAHSTGDTALFTRATDLYYHMAKVYG